MFDEEIIVFGPSSLVWVFSVVAEERDCRALIGRGQIVNPQRLTSGARHRPGLPFPSRFFFL